MVKIDLKCAEPGKFNLFENKSEDFPPKIQIPVWERFWCRLRKSSPYTHDRIVNEIAKTWGKENRKKENRPEGKVKFLIRVDDFPRWDLPLGKFLHFDAILDKFGLRYSIGVTPRIATDPLNPLAKCEHGLSSEATAIMKSISNRVDIALHGLTHRVRSSQMRSEFRGLRPEIVENYIIDGLNLLEKLDARPIAFIPPYNSISVSALPILSRYFQFLFGGPESVATLGFRISPSILSGMIYLPSYPPAYGIAKDIHNFVKRLKQINLPIIIPLTIHWAWEERDNFSAFERLCKELVGHTISLSTIPSCSAEFDDYVMEKA